MSIRCVRSRRMDEIVIFSKKLKVLTITFHCAINNILVQKTKYNINGGFVII